MEKRISRTAVMTDTNSGMTVAEGTWKGVYVLPLPVLIENDEYYEGVDITHEAVYQAMSEGKDVSTSQPAPGELIEKWDSILASGFDEVVYIPMSSALSSSYNTAKRLAAEYKGKVTIVDNHRISVTLYTSVLEAAQLAKQGRNGWQIKEYLEKKAYDASIYITVDSVEYLKKSGRITEAGAMLAAIMKIKPILKIDGGKLDAFSKTRGMTGARKKMLAAIKKDREERFGNIPDSNLIVALAGTMRSDRIVQLAIDSLKEEFPEHPFLYRPLSCSIASHTGPDSIGFGLIEVPEGLITD